ncbi:hypothetical protein JCM3766R1_005124 [Sporobolomyces carnicolor]
MLVSDAAREVTTRPADPARRRALSSRAGPRGSEESDLTGEDSYDSVDTDEYSPPKRSLEERASTFHDQAQGVKNQLEPLSATYDSILALSSRLLALHPNSIETPTLALDLRDALVHLASTLRAVDSNLFDLCESEELVRNACSTRASASASASAPASEDSLLGASRLDLRELERRRREVDSLVTQFRRRCKDIQHEAKWERHERREVRDEKKEPIGVGDYLASGLDCPDLTKKDVVHASRWVVTNPFTILAKLLDNTKSLRIPQMVASEQTPSTFLARPISTRSGSFRTKQQTARSPQESTPFLIENPTPAGSRRHRLADWKARILRDAGPATPNRLHRALDTFSDNLEGGYKVRDHGRARSEKWIIIVSLAFLPLILLSVVVQKVLFNSDRESSESTMTVEASSRSSLLSTLFPSMVNQEGTQETRTVATTTTTTGTVRGTSSSRNMRRRRESIEFDAELV